MVLLRVDRVSLAVGFQVVPELAALGISAGRAAVFPVACLVRPLALAIPGPGEGTRAVVNG